MKVIKLDEELNTMNEDLLFEMANIPKKDTNLPYDIWIDSAGSSRKNKHTLPRVKVLVSEMLIPILIDKDNPEIPDSVKKTLGFDRIAKQSLISNWIKKHYDTLMRHWNNELTDRETLDIIYKEDNK